MTSAVCDVFICIKIRYNGYGHIVLPSRIIEDHLMEKLSDDKVILTNEEYRHLLENNERLADAERRANAANKAKSDFLSSMSHEIRTPMNTVLGMNELVRMTLADPDLPIGEKIGRVVGYSDGIQHAGEMLLYVINDILDISRIESGKFEIRTAPYHMKRLLEDMIQLFTINADAKSLLFEYSVDEDLPGYVEGDEVRIRQIVTNIVNNAVKYTKEGTVRLEVSGRCQGEEVIYDIAVRDTGIGIKQENLAHLFDSFERIDSEETHYIEGTGLGLAIVKSLLDLMGGFVEVESEYGIGSVFTAHIPQKILSEEKIRDYIPDTDAADLENEHHLFRGRKILVVDDNTTNLVVARSFLERMKVTVETVTSGKEAIEKISSVSYDMIFLDHMMPQMSGVKVIKEVRRNPDKYEINIHKPFIVMTANAIAGAKEKYINEYGFDGYIAKPFRFAELDHLLSMYLEDDVADACKDEPSPGGNNGMMPGGNKSMMPGGNSGMMPEGARAGMGGPPPGVTGEVWDINFDMGIEACGDRETYSLVADTYLEIYEENVSNLEKYRNEEDWENYMILVHALKSSSKSVGAVNFSGFSMSIEHAAKELAAGNEIEKNIGYLRGSFRSYMAAYAAVCDNLRHNKP